MWPFKKREPEPVDLQTYWDSLDLDEKQREAEKIPHAESRRMALTWIQIIREDRQRRAEECN